MEESQLQEAGKHGIDMETEGSNRIVVGGVFLVFLCLSLISIGFCLLPGVALNRLDSPYFHSHNVTKNDSDYRATLRTFCVVQIVVGCLFGVCLVLTLLSYILDSLCQRIDSYQRESTCTHHSPLETDASGTPVVSDGDTSKIMGENNNSDDNVHPTNADAIYTENPLFVCVHCYLTCCVRREVDSEQPPDSSSGTCFAGVVVLPIIVAAISGLAFIIMATKFVGTGLDSPSHFVLPIILSCWIAVLAITLLAMLIVVGTIFWGVCCIVKSVSELLSRYRASATIVRQET